VLLAAGSAVAQYPDQSWLDQAELEAREVQVRASRDGSAVTVDTAALIDAPVEAIWAVLKACEVAPEYVPNVVACERIEEVDDGQAELFMQTIKPIFFMPRFEHVFRLEYHPYERIDVSEVSGPIEHMQGSWWFLPRPEGAILLMHSLEVDPGFPVPRFMLRATMRRDLVKIMEAVRDRAEASAD
jgi:ribosome-associated toxin RatA of RatAB toxin-antitoxin module